MFELPNATGSPERRLILGILERAILDFVGNDERERQDAESWLFDELDGAPKDDQEGGAYRDFSFPWICQQLDLPLEETAEQIRQMPRRGNMRVAPWYFNKDYTKKARAKMEERYRA